MPFTLDEYKVGQLFATNQKSRDETDGNSVIQILENEPFSDERGSGQYTHKRVHFGNKLPRFLDMCLPEAYKVIDEHSWNMFPICQTGIRLHFLIEQ